MGRNIGCHTNGNTGGTVYQQVWEMRWQNGRLHQTVIVVWLKIYGFFFNVGEQYLGELAHSCFCITISSRRVTVYGTEVTVTVHQRIPHGEILCQTNKGVIHRGITVGVIPSQHGTYRIGTFAVCLVGMKSVFKHGIQNTAMHRLQTIPHIR